MHKQSSFFYNTLKLSFLIGAAFLVSCAQIVAPTGGPRDTTPPKITKLSPENNHISFVNGTTIQITFDEYMEIQNPSEKVMISPPLMTSPIFKTSGKQVLIQFEDTLKQNTTYTMFFDNCIRDITEGNSISAFKYIFSTGNKIDSGRINGKVMDAESVLPEKQVYVMLYTDNVDSLPSTQRPYYLTKTNDFGEFEFAHIGLLKYKLFVLSDKNNNLLFDQFTEKIGFIDSTLEANNASNLMISMFFQTDTTQRILKKTSADKGKTLFVFKKKTNNPVFTLKNGVFKERFFVEPTKGGDSIFLLDTYMTPDTVTLFVEDQGMKDTLDFVPSVERKNTRRAGEGATKIFVTFQNNKELYKPLELKLSYPVKEIQKDKIKLFNISKDTTMVDFKITNKDSIQTKFSVDFEKIENQSYYLQILDSAFVGYNLLTNDTIVSHFTILTENDYGNLIINFENTKKLPAFVQLINEYGEVVNTISANESKKLVWQNLSPGTYKVRAIMDENRNLKWDNGDYFKKKYPETILNFSSPIQIRAKWDIEEKFIVN